MGGWHAGWGGASRHPTLLLLLIKPLTCATRAKAGYTEPTNPLFFVHTFAPAPRPALCRVIVVAALTRRRGVVSS